MHQFTGLQTFSQTLHGRQKTSVPALRRQGLQIRYLPGAPPLVPANFTRAAVDQLCGVVVSCDTLGSERGLWRVRAEGCRPRVRGRERERERERERDHRHGYDVRRRDGGPGAPSPPPQADRTNEKMPAAIVTGSERVFVCLLRTRGSKPESLVDAGDSHACRAKRHQGQSPTASTHVDWSKRRFTLLQMTRERSSAAPRSAGREGSAPSPCRADRAGARRRRRRRAPRAVRS